MTRRSHVPAECESQGGSGLVQIFKDVVIVHIIIARHTLRDSIVFLPHEISTIYSLVPLVFLPIWHHPQVSGLSCGYQVLNYGRCTG